MKLLLLLLAASAAADRVLVLVDNMSIRESHSIFFKSITDRGHIVTFKNADEGSLQLIKFGELQYDNLIIFAPSADEFGGTITAAEIARFVCSFHLINGIILDSLTKEEMSFWLELDRMWDLQ